MTPLTCEAALRALQAFYDGELPVSRQIAVSSHVDGCERCAAALADLDRLGSWLREAAPGHTPLPCDEAGALISTVVNRAKVEHDASLGVRLHDLLGDLPLMYAGVGAAAATIACLVLMLGMMRFATIERSDSLAGILNFLATQGSNENPFVVDARVMMPRALDTTFSSGELVLVGDDDDVVGNLAGRDAVVTLSAVVTREGTVANLALLDDGREAARGANGAAGIAGIKDAKRVEELLDAVSRARFEPATRQGLPVAVNMVWLVTHTTVRAAKHHPLRGISKT
jgi:hypothetical protein